MRTRAGALSITFVVIAGTGLLLFFWNTFPTWRNESRDSLAASAAASLTSSNGAHEPFVVPPLAREYRNKTFKFTLSIPDKFHAGELSNESSEAQTILLQNQEGEGIQIVITPFPEDVRVLSAERVRADIPDMSISDVQPVEIGSDHEGIAFLSDNEAFGGASREVWFVFRGNLYQISTYAHLDPLLQSVFRTWQFF